MQSVVTKEEGKNSDWVLVGMEIAPLTGSWYKSNCLILKLPCFSKAWKKDYIQFIFHVKTFHHFTQSKVLTRKKYVHSNTTN